MEKGRLPEVLPRTWRAFFLSAVGGVHGQWANLSLNPPQQGCHPDLEDPEGWDPPECFEHAKWPQIQFVGVLASPTPVTQPMAQTVVSASREIAAFSPDFSEQCWYEEEEP